MMTLLRLSIVLLAGMFVFTACNPGAPAAPPPTEPAQQPDPSADVPAPTGAPRLDPARYADYEIITLLPQDAIPAVDNPTFLSAAEADEEYEPDELVIGVAFDGEARAYSVPFLSSHEIVNDTISGRKIAVTW